MMGLVLWLLVLWLLFAYVSSEAYEDDLPRCMGPKHTYIDPLTINDIENISLTALSPNSKTQAPINASELWKSSESDVLVLFIARMPGCWKCREQAFDLVNYLKSSKYASRLTVKGILKQLPSSSPVETKESYSIDINEFQQSYFDGNELFFDREQAFYKALGSRSLIFQGLPVYNPFMLYGALSSTAKRLQSKGIRQGRKTGSGWLQGGVIIISSNQIVYTYREMTGYELPVIDIDAALTAVFNSCYTQNLSSAEESELSPSYASNSSIESNVGINSLLDDNYEKSLAGSVLENFQSQPPEPILEDTQVVTSEEYAGESNLSLHPTSDFETEPNPFNPGGDNNNKSASDSLHEVLELQNSNPNPFNTHDRTTEEYVIEPHLPHIQLSSTDIEPKTSDSVDDSYNGSEPVSNLVIEEFQSLPSEPILEVTQVVASVEYGDESDISLHPRSISEIEPNLHVDGINSKMSASDSVHELGLEDPLDTEGRTKEELVIEPHLPPSQLSSTGIEPNTSDSVGNNDEKEVLSTVTVSEEFQSYPSIPNPPEQTEILDETTSEYSNKKESVRAPNYESYQEIMPAIINDEESVHSSSIIAESTSETLEATKTQIEIFLDTVEQENLASDALLKISNTQSVDSNLILDSQTHVDVVNDSPVLVDVVIENTVPESYLSDGGANTEDFEDDKINDGEYVQIFQENVAGRLPPLGKFAHENT